MAQKHNSTMVSNASPGSADPKMNKSFVHIWHMHLPTVHAHRMGTSSIPIQPLLMEICGGTVVGFLVVLGLGDFCHAVSKAEAREKNTPQPWRLPSPYGRYAPPPPAPLHTTISQHAVPQVYVIKLKNFIVVTIS
jgi:hypothetical protein